MDELSLPVMMQYPLAMLDGCFTCCSAARGFASITEHASLDICHKSPLVRRLHHSRVVIGDVICRRLVMCLQLIVNGHPRPDMRHGLAALMVCMC